MVSYEEDVITVSDGDVITIGPNDIIVGMSSDATKILILRRTAVR